MMKEIKTEIEINASREAIWHTLVDFKPYNEWNPIISNVKGSAEVNRGIRFQLHIMGRKLPIAALVHRSEENWYFGWGGKQGSKVNLIVGAHHYFEIHEINSEKSKLIHGEIFYGVIPFVAWPIIKKLERSYNEMNLALKKHVEVQRR